MSRLHEMIIMRLLTTDS